MSWYLSPLISPSALWQLNSWLTSALFSLPPLYFVIFSTYFIRAFPVGQYEGCYLFILIGGDAILYSAFTHLACLITVACWALCLRNPKFSTNLKSHIYLCVYQSIYFSLKNMSSFRYSWKYISILFNFLYQGGNCFPYTVNHRIIPRGYIPRKIFHNKGYLSGGYLQQPENIARTTFLFFYFMSLVFVKQQIYIYRVFCFLGNLYSVYG